GTEPGGDGGLRRVARVRGSAELLGGQDLQHRIGFLGEPGGELIGGIRVDALELIEEGKLLLLLFGMLGDLLALPLDVGLDDLGGRTLGQERSGGHRERRRDGAGEPGGEHDARSARRSRDSGDDAEYGRESVVCAVDRSRDPASASLVSLLAIQYAVESI